MHTRLGATAYTGEHGAGTVAQPRVCHETVMALSGGEYVLLTKASTRY